jgi:hypothetical protein
MTTLSFFDTIKLQDDTLVDNKCIINIENFQTNMLTLKNLIKFTKLIDTNNITQNIKNNKNMCINNITNSVIKHNNINSNKLNNIKDKYYYIKQKDTLFWCFYILKNSYSSYEMECNNNYFTIEKQEKYKYVELLREEKNKNLLKMFKIKPLLDLENDLANNDKISVKTFFGLCLIEGINILLVDGRKLYELLCSDSSNINIIHRNIISNEYYIESDFDNKDIDKYKNSYFNMPSLDFKIKSISSYKIDDLLEICEKLNIQLDNYRIDKKKFLKKDIYELVVQQFR